MRAPFFSIITVTKNNLNGLRNTALSVQTQSDYEWIVIDGNSNDGTQEFLEKSKALWISAPDDGLYDAMNKGIDRANGIYLIFMNAGDVFASTSILNKIKTILPDTLPDFIYGDALEENRNGDPHYKKARSANKLASGMPTHHQAMFYKRDKIGSLRYDLKYKLAADYDFTCRFLNQNTLAYYIDDPICLFESGGLSQQNAKQSRLEEFQIRKHLGVNALKSIVSYARQTIAYAIKTTMPSLFWKLKA